jgi:hypothetical protein
MTRNDDFDQTLAAWLRREAPSQAPDRVLEIALERVAVQSQKRSWQQRLIGDTKMTTFTRTAALTAVLAIAALIGFQFGNLNSDVGRSSPPPTLVATPSPSPTPIVVPSASLPAGCVNPPADITALIDQQIDPDADPVACYGDAPLTLEANWVGGGVADCPSAPEPAWLACSSFSLRAVGDTRKVGAPELSVAIQPTIGSLPDVGTDVRVTGHYDDPAAQTCRETALGGGAETLAPAAEMIDRCRRAFVITEVVAL